MLLLLAKRIRCSISIHPRFLSSSPETQNPHLGTPKFVVADYLAATFGFSPVKAAKVSKSIAYLKSPEKPDSVIGFLKQHGFSDPDIKTLVTGHPFLLCSSPQHTLHPNLTALRNMGLSTTTLNKIFLSSPAALFLPSAVSRITFWKDFLDGDEAALVKAFTRNMGLITRDITKSIAPKISLLQRYGFSNKEIVRIICTCRRFIISKASRMEDLLKRTEELGFQPGSGMFLQGLHAMIAANSEALQEKMGLFKRFGWSEEELMSALRKSPLMVALTGKNLCAKMDFLLGEARCEAAYIASHPILLTYSLEKRLRPRNNVLLLLDINSIYTKNQDFLSAIQPTNNLFVDRYIRPHMEKIPGLHEAYIATCAAVPEKGEH